MNMDSDSDSVEIIDVIIYDIPEKKVSNKLSEMSAIDPSKNSSNTSENISDVHIQLEEIKTEDEEPISVDVEMNPENDSNASENISNVHIQLEAQNEQPIPVNVEINPEKDSKNDSNDSENISDVHIQPEEAQNENEKPIPVNVEISSEKDSKNEDDCLPVNNLELNSETNTLTESHLNSNCSEKINLENTIGTTEVKEHEIPCDSGMCDDMMDLTHENDEYCSYDIKYDFNCTPTQICASFKEFNSGKKSNFTRGCKWAPDGSCILTCSDDNKLRLFNLPSQLWDSSQWSHVSDMDAALRIAEGDLIYDYCWYPLMNSNDVSTCCLVSTSRKSTVHMWDAYTGELRCSYRSFNHLDELVTPHSLSFDSDGEKLFCGFTNVIRVFDVNRPGRFFEERNIYAYKTGQCGIISCFAFTSADKNVSAAGSYMNSIGLYAEPYGELSCLLEGQANGITQLQFSPDGKYLYSAGRKNPEILCWDLRNLGTVLFSMRRSSETNQRMYFDISKCGKYVVSGNQNGVITFWDVTKEPRILNENDFSLLLPTNFFLAHEDCVNGVSFHPFYPLLCSSSGQRKFPDVLDDDSEDIFSFKTNNEENSLRLWWLGGKSKK